MPPSASSVARCRPGPTRSRTTPPPSPYDKLVRLVRTGPPIWSYFRLPWVDGQLNTLEYYVHHEDVRRGRFRLGRASSTRNSVTSSGID